MSAKHAGGSSSDSGSSSSSKRDRERQPRPAAASLTGPDGGGEGLPVDGAAVGEGQAAVGDAEVGERADTGGAARADDLLFVGEGMGWDKERGGGSLISVAQRRTNTGRQRARAAAGRRTGAEGSKGALASSKVSYGGPATASSSSPGLHQEGETAAQLSVLAAAQRRRDSGTPAAAEAGAGSHSGSRRAQPARPAQDPPEAAKEGGGDGVRARDKLDAHRRRLGAHDLQKKAGSHGEGAMLQLLCSQRRHAA